MFITISGESAALTYLENKPDKTFSPLRRVCVSTVHSQLSLLLPVLALRVTRALNQSDGAVGGTMLEIPNQKSKPWLQYADRGVVQCVGAAKRLTPPTCPIATGVDN